MKKVIEKLKAFCAWVGADGFMRTLLCCNLMLAFFPMFSDHYVGALAASLITAFSAIVMEAYSLILGKTTGNQVGHHFLCDIMGMASGALSWGWWWLCNL